MRSSKSIAKNTLFLYVRMLLTMGVSLYASRIVLQVLGVEDFGIYTVIGGIVSFFSFLTGTMASATQRFFAFALGEKDFEKLRKIFTINWLIYGAIAIIALIILETIGLWFVNEKLKVPIERLDSVKWIYHFSVLTFISAIFSTPFKAIIIAHEDMYIYAYVSIIEAIMKLSILFLLIYLPGDKLELYAMLLFGISVVNSAIYFVVSVKRYSECQFRRFYWDKGLLFEIVGFTGWTLFGQVTTVGRNQAITILLNQVFNPIVVAARAIAMNVATQINLFSNNFNVGLYPPIIKSYAAEDKKEMFFLITNGSKITFFLMWVFTLPLFLELDVILKIWLGNPPVESVLFTRLALVEVLINSISLPIATAARAPGKMKTYEGVLGTIQIGIFVAAWLILKMGAPAYFVFLIAIVANLIMFIARLLIVRNMIGLPLKPFFYQVVLPILLVIFMSIIPSFAIHWLMPKGFLFACISIISGVVFACISMYIFGLDKVDREKLQSVVKNRFLKAA